MENTSNKHLDRVEAKVDKVLDQVSQINSTLAGQHEQLTYHIKRTDLLEARLTPLEAFMARLLGAGVVLVSLASIAAFLKYLI